MTDPLPVDAALEAEVLSDPAVRGDATVQLALQVWLNNSCTLERALLDAVRALAREKAAPESGSRCPTVGAELRRRA
jgi:hypothetical protein